MSSDRTKASRLLPLSLGLKYGTLPPFYIHFWALCLDFKCLIFKHLLSKKLNRRTAVVSRFNRIFVHNFSVEPGLKQPVTPSDEMDIVPRHLDLSSPERLKSTRLFWRRTPCDRKMLTRLLVEHCLLGHMRKHELIWQSKWRVI